MPAMSVHIIIDGYNLIRRSSQWSQLDAQDIELGREALLEALAGYKRIKTHRITVVFDGAEAISYVPKNDTVSGISVIYSRSGESADTVIKRLANQYGEKALVVSSDRDVSGYAARQGAGIIESSDFEMKIALAVWGETEDEEDESGWIPTTKKKGPGRRLSKRKRRNLSKTQKL